MSALGSVYGAAAAWRRRWYAREPARRRRLRQPVISVGNLSVGGSGKTPIVAHLARILTAQGERPAILSRGYGRSRTVEGATVVSDGSSVVAGLDVAGDEPLMLARALPAVPVVVGPNRYLSGRLAEERFGATVHLLDDGFQHFELERDVDLLVAGDRDVADTPLPFGRLREGLAAAAAAHAALVESADDASAAVVAGGLGLSTFFRVVRGLGVPWMIARRDDTAVPPRAPIFAVAAIARPERFYDDLRAQGWNVVGTMRFRDHHRFTPGDLERIATAARTADVNALVMTTEKDAVRLAARDLGKLAVAAIPLTVAVEPAAVFATWLGERLSASRAFRQRQPGSRP